MPTLRIIMNFLAQLFSSSLLLLNDLLGNVGLALIVFTILIRLILLPLTLPSLKSAKKIKQIQPEIDKLKRKFKGDNQGFALAQSQLYKSYGIKPLAGCLPQILQLVVLLVLYRSITNLFNAGEGLNFQFLWADLSQPDKKYIFPVLTALFQLLLSLMMSPGSTVNSPNKTQQELLKKTGGQEEDMTAMAASMQQQMIFMMPLMTGFISLRLPSGLALYWIIGTLFSLLTQYFVSGWGGIARFWNEHLAKGPLAGKTLAIGRGKDLMKVQQSTKVKMISKKIFQKPQNKQSLNQMAELLAQKGASQEPLKGKNQRATKTQVKQKVKQNRKKAKHARKFKKKK